MTVGRIELFAEGASVRSRRGFGRNTGLQVCLSGMCKTVERSG
nr:MAG TPA: hypothetical protein [Caudoviricetes sp.]